MIYKKIEIKSEADNPPIEGEYYSHYSRELHGNCELRIYDPLMCRWWNNNIDWYLLPISEEEYLREELKKFKDYSDTQPYGYISSVIIDNYLKTRKDER